MFFRKLRCLCALKNSGCNIWSRNINVDFQNNREIINFYMNTFNLPEYRVYSMMLKYPSLQNSETTQLDNALSAMFKVGVSKEDILRNPRVLNVHSKTISNRWTVLTECKINKITLQELSKFKSILRIYTISQLYLKRLLLQDRDLWCDLVECFSYWPDIQHKLLTERINIDPTKTLFDVRMEILKKFLKLHLNYPNHGFDHIMNLYSPIKNRALTTICQVIHLLESIKFSKANILTYGYTLLLDPENISKIISEVKELGGIKVETVLEKYPTIMKNNYKDLLEIKRLLKENGISDEAQQKCLLLYTLCSETVLERLQELKSQPEFRGFETHPRIMSFLYNRTKVRNRMQQLTTLNKKCFSLHKLAAGQKEFDSYINNFGDQTRGIDTLHFLAEKFSPEYSKELIKSTLSRHRFWLSIPVLDVIEVMEFLEKDFNKDDIFYNCHILLYPLKDVKHIVEFLQRVRNGDRGHLVEYSNNYRIELLSMDVKGLSNVKLLGLTTYLMEKNNNFSDAGVWIKPTTSDLMICGV